MLNKKQVEKFYKKNIDGSHGFDHVERVHKLAMKIARNEKSVDLQIVDAAAWLHDTQRACEDLGKIKCHAEAGSKAAEKILNKLNFPINKISAVKHSIEVHRYSKQKKAETKEAKILQDADRLDALGAICVARVLVYNGFHKLPLYKPEVKPEKHYHGQHTTAINHFYEKILKIKPSNFHTKTARKIAKERYAFIETFLKKFKEEWNGIS